MLPFPLPEAVDDRLGPPDRLGDAEAGAGQHPANGRSHPDPMPGRDEDRLHAAARPERRADPCSAEAERAPVAPIRPGVAVLPYQARFGAAHTRKAEENPHLAREAEPPGVSQPLAVKEAEIRTRAETLEGGEKQRSLAEREITRDVGEPRWPSGYGGLHEAALRESQQGDASPGPAAVATVREISPRNQSDSPGPAPELYPGTKPLLKKTRLGNGAGPGGDQPALLSSGSPAFAQPPSPPFKIRTSLKPTRRSCCATRALVPSSGQEQ